MHWAFRGIWNLLLICFQSRKINKKVKKKKKKLEKTVLDTLLSFYPWKVPYKAGSTFTEFYRCFYLYNDWAYLQTRCSGTKPLIFQTATLSKSIRNPKKKMGTKEKITIQDTYLLFIYESTSQSMTGYTFTGVLRCFHLKNDWVFKHVVLLQNPDFFLNSRTFRKINFISKMFENIAFTKNYWIFLLSILT